MPNFNPYRSAPVSTSCSTSSSIDSDVSLISETIDEEELVVAPCDKEIVRAMGANFKKSTLKWYVKKDNLNYLRGHFAR